MFRFILTILLAGLLITTTSDQKNHTIHVGYPEKNYVELEESKEEKIEKTVEKAKTVSSPKPKTATPISGGNKQTWLQASGIPESQWLAVDSIVSGESGWNPNAINPSSGACGLGQQLPCGKWDSYGAWNNPVAALKAMTDYVTWRYGSWSYAVTWRDCVGWCYNSHNPDYSFSKDHTWY